MERTILNKKQLSNYLGMSIGKIDNLIKDDKIGYYKIGKNVRFNMNEINEWLSKFRNFKL
jgi:excisionase family DNA binding protein